MIQSTLRTKQATLAAANDELIMPVDGGGGVAVQLTGTWAGTVTFSASVDGTNFDLIPATPIAGGATVTSATANGQWTANCAGFSQFKLKRTVATSGTGPVATVGACNVGISGGATVTVDTEFPPAAALADNTANPTTTSVAAFGMVWDGATWDRLPGNSVDGAHVTEQFAPAAEDNTNAVIATAKKPVASATYSASPFGTFLTSVAIAVKGSAGNLMSVYVSNINAAVRYLQIHNKATAPANPDVPIWSFPIPAGSATVPGTLELGEDFFGSCGKNLATGIAVGISTTAATYTAATTTDHCVNGSYV